MTSSVNSSTRQDLLRRLRLHREWNRRQARRHPENFRRLLRLNADDPRPLADLLQPWQTRDFRALDPAWIRLAGTRPEQGVAEPPVPPTEPVPYQRAFLERPRGHSKTSDMALQLLWILWAAQVPLSGLVAAADRDQAQLVQQAMRRLTRRNPGLCSELRFLAHAVCNPATGSRLDIISSDVSSSWGVLPDFVVCDELCHWSKPDLWQSLYSSAAKQPDCILAILTNAGLGRGWQWDVREHARRDPAWYFSSLAGPQAPWITRPQLDEQRALLPRPVFERLWLNIWQHSDGEFVTLAEAQACRDAHLTRRDRGDAQVGYVAVIDYAEKRDLTVGCLCHRDGGRIVVDRMDVVQPAPDRPTPVQWVEDWMADIARRFPHVTFVVDPYQLVGTIQRLGGRYPIERFEFLAGAANHALAITLRQHLLERRVAWYAGCGQLAGVSGRDDLETELASLLLRQSASGRVRIDHRADGTHHDDRSFALGAACLHLCRTPAQPDFLQITPPTHGGEIAW